MTKQQQAVKVVDSEMLVTFQEHQIWQHLTPRSARCGLMKRPLWLNTCC